MLQMSSSSNYERQTDNSSNVNQMQRNNRNNKKIAAPFLFLSNILKKKKIIGFEEIREINTRTRSEPSVVSYSCSLPSRQPAVSSLSLTPARIYSKKDIEYDMQQLKLSRSDNPYLQKKLASRDEINMIDMDETDDDTNLIPNFMSQEGDNEDVFSHSDVIENMIRSPPPVWRPIGSAFNFPNIDDSDERDLDFVYSSSNKNNTCNKYTSSPSSLNDLKFAQ